MRLPFRAALHDPQVRVALVAAAALLLQAVLAKNVLDVQIDFISQNAALWVFIAFLLGEQRSRTAELATDGAIVLVTTAVLVLYSI